MFGENIFLVQVTRKIKLAGEAAFGCVLTLRSVLN